MKWALRAIAAGILLFVIGSCGERRLPAVSSLKQRTISAPEQVALKTVEILYLRFGGKVYTLHPRARYKLNGLIVSQHRSESVWDSMHERTGDYLNSRDFCVVWGKMLASGLYERVSFRSGDWTCYMQASAADAPEVDYREVANNHVLAKDDSIRSALDKLETGDEVEITGQLVDYDIDGIPFRKTSLVRDDTENGACETLYVESVRVIASHGRWWRSLRKAGAGLSLVAFAAIVAIMLQTIRASRT